MRCEDHRPWPMPARSWRMKQVWQHVLFAHWPIAAEQLEPWLPTGMKLDLYEGQAWVGVVPFTMSGICLRFLPEVPFTSRFAEINVRTYVTINGKPGVFFFSLDAANLFAVKAARLFYHLPYYFAAFELRHDDAWIHYRSKRKQVANFEFTGKYRPTSPHFFAEKGTLEHWFTERYCLYTSHKERLFCCEIHHDPWPLQLAEAEIDTNTMVPIDRFDPHSLRPLLHYSERLDVLTWGIEEVCNQ